jgi:hypothetical protein
VGLWFYRRYPIEGFVGLESASVRRALDQRSGERGVEGEGEREAGLTIFIIPTRES